LECGSHPPRQMVVDDASISLTYSITQFACPGAWVHSPVSISMGNRTRPPLGTAIFALSCGSPLSLNGGQIAAPHSLSQWGCVGCPPLSLNGGRDFFIFWPISRPQLRPYILHLVFPIESQWGIASRSPLSLSMGAVRLFPIQLNGGLPCLVLARFCRSDQRLLSRFVKWNIPSPYTSLGDRLPSPTLSQWGRPSCSPSNSMGDALFISPTGLPQSIVVHRMSDQCLSTSDTLPVLLVVADTQAVACGQRGAGFVFYRGGRSITVFGCRLTAG